MKDIFTTLQVKKQCNVSQSRLQKHFYCQFIMMFYITLMSVKLNNEIEQL